jgi:hypothetical protein
MSLGVTAYTNTNVGSPQSQHVFDKMSHPPVGTDKRNYHPHRHSIALWKCAYSPAIVEILGLVANRSEVDDRVLEINGRTLE